MNETPIAGRSARSKTAPKALVVALAIAASVVSGQALEDGARTVEIVALWGAAFAAGAGFAALVSEMRHDRGR